MAHKLLDFTVEADGKKFVETMKDTRDILKGKKTPPKGRPTPKREAPTAAATAASKHALDAMLGINAGASSPKETPRYRNERRLKNRTARRSRRLNRTK